MVRPRLALWLVDRADDSGVREPLIGDLLEEIARGRSRLWVWQQVIGVCGFAFAAYARRHARLTPSLVAGAVGAVMLGGMSIVSVHHVLETWILLYLMSGTASLFAHVMAGAANSPILLVAADSEIAEGR